MSTQESHTLTHTWIHISKQRKLRHETFGEIVFATKYLLSDVYLKKHFEISGK